MNIDKMKYILENNELDYFEKTRYLPYLFQQFSIEKDNTKKIKLMQNIEYELIQSNDSYPARCILDDTMFQDFFNFSKQKKLGIIKLKITCRERRCHTLEFVF